MSGLLDIRVKISGVNVRLKGFGNRKLINLRILQTGLTSVKARLASGLDSSDSKAKPLTKRYAIQKSRLTGGAAKRDLRLTGAFLDTFLPRYADGHQAVANSGGRLGRLKAIKYRNMINFSANDERAMSAMAKKLIREEFSRMTLTGKPGSRFQLNTSFARAA